MGSKGYYFNPHIGKNHCGKLVLLATTGCCHSDCHHWEKCTKGYPSDFEDCPYPDYDENGHKIKLSDTVIHMIDKFIRDDFDGERRYRTYTCLTNAVSCALGGTKVNRWETDRISEIWSNFLCTEFCQHFIPCTKDEMYKDRNSVETKYSDFTVSDSFSKLLVLIQTLESDGILLKRIMILGKPSFEYFKNCCKEQAISFEPETTQDGYWHKLILHGRLIEVLYTYHPSYSKYYDWGQNNESCLIPELKRFFRD